MPTLHATWKRADGKCYYCKKETTIKTANNKKMRHDHATKEHLIPKSQGGSNRVPNIKLACHQCNTMRDDMCAIEWMTIVNSPSKLKAFYRVRHLKKKLTIIRRERRKAIRFHIRDNSVDIHVCAV